MEKSTANIDRVTSFYDWANDNNTLILKTTVDVDTIKSFYNQSGSWA